MAFASERDLLVIDPGVYRDGAWTARRVVTGTATIAGTTLTLVSGGPSFEAAGVGPGSVVLVSGRALEVVARTGPSVLTVSVVRGSLSDDPTPPGDTASATTTEVVSFRAELELVHRRVLRMLGIEPEDTWSDDPLTEADVMNPEEFAEVEALGALHLIYAALSAAVPSGGEFARRGEAYRERFERERRRARALIDLDADGRPDATRRLNAVVSFVRV